MQNISINIKSPINNLQHKTTDETENELLIRTSDICLSISHGWYESSHMLSGGRYCVLFESRSSMLKHIIDGPIKEISNLLNPRSFEIIVLICWHAFSWDFFVVYNIQWLVEFRFFNNIGDFIISFWIDFLVI